MFGKKPSGAQRKKIKVDETRESSKSSKLLECFLKKVKSTPKESQHPQDTDVDEFIDQPSVQQNQQNIENSSSLSTSSNSEVEDKMISFFIGQI